VDREDIIHMAEEAGFPICVGFFGEMMGTFANLVAAHEREQSAKVVENYCGAWDDQGYALANAIRRRGKK